MVTATLSYAHCPRTRAINGGGHAMRFASVVDSAYPRCPWQRLPRTMATATIGPAVRAPPPVFETAIVFGVTIGPVLDRFLVPISGDPSRFSLLRKPPPPGWLVASKPRLPGPSTLHGARPATYVPWPRCVTWLSRLHRISSVVRRVTVLRKRNRLTTRDRLKTRHRFVGRVPRDHRPILDFHTFSVTPPPPHAIVHT